MKTFNMNKVCDKKMILILWKKIDKYDLINHILSKKYNNCGIIISKNKKFKNTPDGTLKTNKKALLQEQ
jgi:hypothetical protein